ncbi:NADH-quinone oxidoreductase subunit M [Candidatus Finniella inopinata]|uniref:NADH-quinone oxidoreductase subunit M n=1 Tax=Candidatus Finniella inopinata TaxID=1696036 RepID=A0A4Q7DMR1_9PROT|nr:NADH-quinone oxidoreductase subunit M [Candidatus Finniella inopinata]RZI46106.1 NADH-quinone oxidoreductase subunit M [Candidatus Finniella inopinata]
MTLPFLSLMIFLPLSGVFFLGLVRPKDERNAKSVALWISSINFALGLILWAQFNRFNSGYQLVEKHEWCNGINIFYYLGIDGISLYFVMLTTLLTPLCIIFSWHTIQKRVREYMMVFLLLETLLLGSFCALDLVLFYIFFEGTLIPLFLIIGVWGGEGRTHACFKFFLYTLLGSIFMLLAVAKLYSEFGTTEIPSLVDQKFSPLLESWIWVAFFIAMAVKIPMWPFHTWLPYAHVEAPTAGSVMLAGVLLKLGGYGFARIVIPMLPDASTYFAPFVMTLSVIAIFYTSLVALAQTDMKKLIAYSSIAHMGFVTLGLFSLTPEGTTGAILSMLSHGLISSALFFMVGMLYDRFHALEIKAYGGLHKAFPKLAALFLIFTFSSIAVPGTGSFVAEFLILYGTFQINTVFTTLALSGVVLGAAYSLWLYHRLFNGKLVTPLNDSTDMTSSDNISFGHKSIETKTHQRTNLDLTFSERFILCYLLVVVLAMGIYPRFFTKHINKSVRQSVLLHHRISRPNIALY